MRDIRDRTCGNLRLNKRIRVYVDPRAMIERRDPILAELLRRSLNGERVDLRSHLTRR